MYLEKLVIQGFKSFANKNELLFPGALKDGKHGLTAIVGPNGSGKSNTADAVRWALGEQSMKTLRGKKSEDVIFSGSDKKGQLGMAEVSLYLNNEDGKGLIDFSQIVLTRRLYRDGQSEYLLNGAKARLLDIQMLLAKANFGQKTYSVIGQGMVENFLNTSLSERKEFFDEATGVRQYQIKREDALNKLKLSIENLAQSQMLVNEIEPRLKNLSKQMARLEKKGQYLLELDDLQLNYYANSWQHLSKLLNEAQQGMISLDIDLKDKQQRADKLEQDLQAMSQEQSVGDEFDEYQRELSLTRERSAVLNRQVEYLNQWLNLSQASLPFDESLWTAEQEDLQVKILSAKAELQLQQTKPDIRPKITDLNNKLSELEIKRSALMREVHRLDAFIEMKLESLGKFDLSFLNSRASDLKTNLEQANKESAEIDLNINTNNNKLNNLKSEFKDAMEEFNKLNSEWRQLSAEGDNLNTREVNTRLEKSLIKLEQAAQENDLDKIRTALNEIKQELNEAINFSTGRELKDRLERLNQSSLTAADRRESINSQINKLQLEINTATEKKKMFAAQINRWQTELVEVEKKQAKGQEKFDADSVQAERATANHAQDAIAVDIKKLNEELNKLRLEDEAKRSDYNSARNKLESLEREFNNWQRKYADAKLVAARTDARREDVEKQIKAFNDSIIFNLELIKIEQENIGKLQTTATDKISSLKAKLDEFNALQEQKRRKLVDCQRALQLSQTEANRLAAALNDEKLKAVRHETRLEDLELEIHENYDHLDNIKKHQVGDSFESAEAGARIKHLRHQVELIGSVDEDLEKEYADTSERFNFLSGQTGDLTNTIKSLEEVIRELDGTIRERFDKEFEIISTKFEEYFKILFNGGTAKIIKVMSDELDETNNDEINPEINISIAEDNPLQVTLKKLKTLSSINATGLAGIEIQATPPGKKIKSIAMLSGGERALTAIALISAIISANPSPFVVLDEVDAALDEANSERLAKILDDLSSKTQFIVITHNRAPMRKAAILYGVTMQDDGVSKLLSVKLEEAK